MSTTDPSPFRFAAARAVDANDMRALAIGAYSHYVERMPQPPAPMLLDYDAVVAAGETTLAWQDDALVGMITVVVEADSVLVQNVAVAPETQGTGLGSKLLAHAEAVARTAHRPCVRLYTNEAMTENLDYYVRRGFTEMRRAEDNGYRRVFFEKRLSAPLESAD